MYNNYSPYYNPYYPNNGAMPDNLNQLRNQQQPIQQQNAQPVQQPMQQPIQQPMQNNSGIVWVLGEANAKSYPVAPGCTVSLWDKDVNTIYLKTVDAFGVPSMRIYDYTERTNNAPISSQNAPINDFKVDFDKFVTRDELNEILANLTAITPKKSDKKTKGETENG